MRVVLLSGGGGGARFARGLRDVLGPGELTVVANVADDLEILGVHVSPDLDGVLYALAGLSDDERGWGRAGESWNALESASAWGGADWFRLGDRDLGLHLVRTEGLRAGQPLSEVTAHLVARTGTEVTLLPASDDPLRTRVRTPGGEYSFQEWYVGRRHEDEVDDVHVVGAEGARPAPGVVEAIEAADAVLIAPSNPYLSIGPVLAVAGIRRAIEERRSRCVAVSPVIGGQAVTGPLGRMLSRMAGGTTPAHVAGRYGGLLDALVIDEADAPAEAAVELVVTSIRMTGRDAERRLATAALEVACG